MSATGDAASHYLTTAGTFTPFASAYSYSFWYYATSAPTTGSNNVIFSLASAGTYEIGFVWSATNASFERAAYHVDSPGVSYVIAQLPSSPATNSWHHISVTWDGSLLRVYVNGVFQASGPGGNPAGTTNPNLWLCCYGIGGVASRWVDGSLAHVCIWNITLTAAEVLSLYTGSSITSLHNANIVFYDPLYSVVPDATSLGPVLTNNAAVLNNTFFFGMAGGEAVGGNQTIVTTQFHHTMAGGVAYGGNLFTVSFPAHMSMVGGVAVTWPFVVTFTKATGAFVLASGREVAHTNR